jgi:two-component system, NtrC family, sensor kinase
VNYANEMVSNGFITPPQVLLMEDESLLAQGFQMVLREEGYGVDLAMTGEDALNTLRIKGYDLLVADLRLPDMDGMEVVKRIKKDNPEIRVIIVTGYADIASALEAFQTGVSDYLSKPLTEREFVNAVNGALKNQGEHNGKERLLRRKDVVRVLENTDFNSNAAGAGAHERQIAAGTHATIEKTLIEEASEGIMASDNHGRIILINNRMEKILGYHKGELAGSVCLDELFPDGMLEKLKIDLNDQGNGDSCSLFLPETCLIDKSGGKIPVQLSVTLLKEKGKEIALIVFARDLKEMRRFEQKFADLPHLLHQDKMMSLGRLAASVVHEINNPLSGILNYVRLMIKIMNQGAIPSTAASEKFRRYLAIVEEEVSRCSTIVSNLLAFSRKSQVRYAEVNIPELLEKCLLLSQHKLDLSHIQVKTTIDFNIPAVWGDFNQIQQCVINLIFNAIDAMESGGALTIETRCDPHENRVEIVIGDNGCGIAEKDLCSIFEPFFTTKKEGKGLGLGLSTVYKIIEQHGGTITVESREKEGTMFTIRLPAIKTR